MSTILQDIRFALRQLRKTPGFTITALLTLALGIGANTAIFTLVHAVMLKSLPVATPSQLYRIADADICCVYGGLGQGDAGWGLVSYGLYKYMQANTPQFEEIAAMQSHRPQVSVRRAGSEAVAETYPSEFVSGNYFSTFGIRPFSGRMFTPQDDAEGAPPTAVMSYRAWEQHFGSDPSVVGSAFMIDGKPFTVIGIAPAGFFGDRLREDPPEFYIPMAFEPLINQKSSILHLDNQYWLYLIGRMKPGIQPGPVESQLNTELKQWLTANISLLPPTARDKIGKQHLKLGPGGAGITSLRKEYQSGLYHADCRFSAGIADRLREPGEPAAGARNGPPSAERSASRSGRQPQPIDSQRAYREHSAGLYGRCRRTCPGTLGNARDPVDRIPWLELRSH